jgi:chitinase
MPALACLLAFACLYSSPILCAGASAPQPVIVAYVFPQDNPLREGEIAGRKLTRINYAFANIKNGRIVSGFGHDDENLAKLVALKQENPSLTVLVSVGGWLWSGAFSDMALTRQSRNIFIASVVDFVRSHQLDGLDIDWEYPGMPGATPHFRPEDKQTYTLLLKELRARFNQLEKELHRPLFVTIATGASQEFLDHTEMDQVQKYVDTINLMAYDYYEPGSGPITGHHAPLFANPADPEKASAANSVEEYEKAGVPAEKIVLGVPFYGHVWGQVPGTNHGLFQPGKEVPHSYAQYGAGPDAMLKNGFIRYWDPIAEAPYLYNAEKQIFMSYEDPESLALKCKYVLAHQLKGIMFWDYESDSSGALLDAVNDGFGRSLEPKGGTQ